MGRVESWEPILRGLLDIILRIPRVYFSWLKSIYLILKAIVKFGLINPVHLVWILLSHGIKSITSKITSLYKIIVPKAKKTPKVTRKSPPKPRIIQRIASLEIRIRIFSFKMFFLIAVFLIGLASFYFYATTLYGLPKPDELANRPPRLSSRIYDRNHQLLYTIFGEENRVLVNLDQVPLYVQQATIAIEDKEFYHHHGFSISGVTRAARATLFYGDVQGGSTITQQLVKITLLNRERTLTRKIRELILSLQVERHYSKEDILQMYLNEINYGGVNYGIAAAAKYYFGKSVEDLSLAEGALLAGLPSAPSRWSPTGTDLTLAKTRQQEVLRRMVEDGYITEDQMRVALAEPLNIIASQGGIKAPHFVMYVMDLLTQKYGRETLERGGLDVFTTLDLNLQDQAQTIVTQEVAKLAYAKVSNGAALIIDPQTGEILAMVGSIDYFADTDFGKVNVTLAERQPGSSIKPVMYSLALQKGYTAATVIEDAAVSYQFAGAKPYTPVNYDGQFHGNVTLRTALANSYNVPAVKTLNTIGVNNFIDHARTMGITTWTDPTRYGLSLTLGGGEVKMIDLAQAYSVIANRGLRQAINPILKIIDYRSQILEENGCALNVNRCQASPILPEEIAFILSDILSDNEARTPAFGAHSGLEIPGYRVAVKTGTTQSFRDNWAIGYTPDRLVAAWVGNNNGDPMGHVVSGISGATPIWHQVMAGVLEGSISTWYPQPENIEAVEICRDTGQLPCNGCPTKIEYFVKGTAPTNQCNSETLPDK